MPPKPQSNIVLTLDGREVDLAKIHLGYSRIKSFQDCGRKFEYSYIHGLRSKPKSIMRQGSAYHDTLEVLLNYKMTRGRLLSLDKALKVAEIKANEQELAKTYFSNVQRGVEYYWHTKYEQHQPMFVEQDFEFWIDDIKVTGRADLGESSGIITDHKFSSDTWAIDRASEGPQPIVYQWAWEHCFEKQFGVKYAGFRYSIIRLYPSQVIQEIDIAPCTEEESAWWKTELHNMIDAIRGGHFMAKPSPDNCKWCDHKKVCKPVFYNVSMKRLEAETDSMAED